MAEHTLPAGETNRVAPCARCGAVDVLNPRPHADLVTCERCAANTVLELAAENIERELICCDVYERLNAKGHESWTKQDRAEKRRHALCYWSSASRALVLAHRIPAAQGRAADD